jgi:glycopeptide antibiotics resistance protein
MKRLSFIAVFICILAFTIYEELFLRSYLFKNHIKPAFIAGSLPNFLSPLIFAFAMAVLKFPVTNKQAGRFIISIVIGLILYEFVQLFMAQQVFDVFDIAATILGGVLAFTVVALLNKL